MEEKKIWKLADVMEYLGCGKKRATKILNMPGCPTLKRKKNEMFYVRADAFVEWFERV